MKKGRKKITSKKTRGARKLYSPNVPTVQYRRLYRLHTFGYMLIISFIIIFAVICYATLLFIFDTIEQTNRSEMFFYNTANEPIEFQTYEDVQTSWEKKHNMSPPGTRRDPFFPAP